jgi:hypothetical protein
MNTTHSLVKGKNNPLTNYVNTSESVSKNNNNKIYVEPKRGIDRSPNKSPVPARKDKTPVKDSRDNNMYTLNVNNNTPLKKFSLGAPIAVNKNTKSPKTVKKK